MSSRSKCALLLSVLIRGAFAQDLSCNRCHPEESRTLTPMARAADLPANTAILKAHSALRVSIAGYTYSIAGNGGRVTYSVSGGGKTLTVDLIRAFGFGSMGQTYLYEYNGALYESRVSYYSAIQGLDLTIGHRNAAEPDIELAAGRRIDKSEESRCFGCHTTDKLPGVRCQRCHTGAMEHARSFAAGSRSAIPPRLSRLTGEEILDMCGECHRTWQDVEANGPHDINNVRFQPYRLATSRCFNSSPQDRRISCTGCHDPHARLEKSAAYYDARCLNCHRAGGAPSAQVCRIGQTGCAGCHMPKTDFPRGHFQFTDHRIRVVRGSGYPN